MVDSLPPALPVSPNPSDDTDEVPVELNNNNAVNLQASVNDTDSRDLTVSFYGRPACETQNFTLVALPDTQLYSRNTGGLLAIFDAQTQSISDSGSSRNNIYTTNLGDIVDTNVMPQWFNANEAQIGLETGSVAYGLALGNHDGAPDSTGNFYSVFPSTRFTGQLYYGGHYGTDNDNSFGLFTSGGLDFVIIQLEYNPSPDSLVLAWANDLLEDLYPSRRGIVVFHDLVVSSTAISTSGQVVYDYLKHNINLFLMPGVHTDTEISLTLTASGHAIYALLSDYQTRPNSVNGWLRLMEFQSAANQAQVYTYSPYLNQWEPDANSEFTLPYTMGGTSCELFQLIETIHNVPSDSRPSVIWYDRDSGTLYEWYIIVSESTYTVSTPVNLINFSATSLPQGIQLDWQTVLEIDLLGFNLFSSESPDDPPMQVNLHLIPAVKPGQLCGNDYQYMDTTAEARKMNFYWIEWAGNGSSELYDPVTASLMPFKVWLALGWK